MKKRDTDRKRERGGVGKKKKKEAPVWSKRVLREFVLLA